MYILIFSDLVCADYSLTSDVWSEASNLLDQIHTPLSPSNIIMTPSPPIPPDRIPAMTFISRHIPPPFISHDLDLIGIALS